MYTDMTSDKDARKQPQQREDYRFFHALNTRWMDNDVYGHVNNVNYYSFFDTAVAAFLLERAQLDFVNDPTVGLVIETSCTYFAPIAFPDNLAVGVRAAKVGKSSVRYEVAIFKNDSPTACAQGYFVHVYVERASQRPASIPEKVRQALTSIVVMTA